MDTIQKALLKVGRKDLAQEYFKKCQASVVKKARDWQRNVRLASLGMTIEILTGDLGDEVELSIGDQSDWILKTKDMNQDIKDKIKIKILDQVEKILKKCNSDILEITSKAGFTKFKM